MVRLVTVNCPYTWKDEVSQVITGLIKRHLIYQNIKSTADENIIYTFKTKDKYLQNVLEEINSVGCGRDYGHIDVMQVLLSRPPISTIGEISGKKKRAYRVSERMTVDEISCFIDDGNHLTFNYMILLFMASLIAGTGLLTDSSTTVIASMLVSPLMGPILSITFGCAVRDLETIRRGMRNEVVGIAISLVTGLIMGFVASFLYPSDYRSSEIVGRGEAINLIGGFIVALASGIAVVVAVTMGGVNAIVGTAISASLLPPIVNCGICLAMSLKYHFDDDSGHDAYQYSLFGSVSLLRYYGYHSSPFYLDLLLFVPRELRHYRRCGIFNLQV